jgi:hypothetical protein
MARKKGGGKGPGAMSMGGMGKKPSMASTPMASAPVGPPGGLGGPGPAGPSPGPLGVKKGGAVKKHALGGEVTKFAGGGDVKARVRAGKDHC